MKKIKRQMQWYLAVTAIFLVLVSYGFSVENLRIAAGAGYKPLLEDWSALYQKQTGTKIERMYGNMGQVLAQVRMVHGICAVIGEKRFLKSSGLPFSDYRRIGTGKLVLVSRKGIKLTSLDDITNRQIERIAIPDKLKAIYGKAAYEVLMSTGFLKKISQKLLPAGTVPRSGSYAVTGDADVAFVNVTFAQKNKKRLGSALFIKDGYQTLEITLASLPSCKENKDLQKFLNFLETPKMRKIVKKHGL